MEDRLHKSSLFVKKGSRKGQSSAAIVVAPCLSNAFPSLLHGRAHASKSFFETKAAQGHAVIYTRMSVLPGIGQPNTSV